MAGESRGYSWPPFTAGNQVAVKHGALSMRTIAPRAQAILAELTADGPSWLHVVDASALTAWAEAEARCDVLRAWVAELGLIDAKGKPTNATDLLLRCERAAMSLRARLGLDPLSRAQLGRDSAIAASAAESAVEQATARGRAIREARELRDQEADDR